MNKRLLIIAALVALHGVSWGQVQIGAPPEWAKSELTPEQKAKAAELRAVEDWRKERIDDKVKTMGEHRRAEIERQVEMEEAARKARGLPFGPTAPSVAAQAPSPPEPAESRQICRQVGGEVFSSLGKGKTRAEAEKATRSFNHCAGRGVQVGVQLQCSEQGGVDLVPTVVDGKATFKRVPKTPVWNCSASYSCSKPKEVCESADGAKSGRAIRN